jgi:hypothetical protein
MKSLTRFLRNQSGSAAVVFGLVFPVLIGGAAAAIEFGMLVHRRTQLQNAADAGVLAAARELTLANPNKAGVTGLAKALTLASLNEPGNVKISSELVDAGVEVTIEERYNNFFGKVLGPPLSHIEVKATARLASTKLCMLALEPDKDKAIQLNASARLTAVECSVFSNSKSRAGIAAADSARVDADLVCSAGGIQGKGNFVKPPTTDCPPVSDPLANRNPPSANGGGCDFKKTEIKGVVRTLNPGTYCDGLKITEGAAVTLSPGIYTIRGGKLFVDKNGSLFGEDVSFFLAGKESSFEFQFDSSISLAAPRSGEMAGILIFDDRGGKFDKHRIYSNDARKLLGTIYLPNGALYIDAKKPIADKSAYTVIVARTVELYDGPDLVLNSNYNQTDVPVPKGVGPMGSTVHLVK